MLIGLPKEIKNNEFRVGLVPSSVAELVKSGHQVMGNQMGAGIGAGDVAYRAAGAIASPTAEQVFDAEMIVKVKEPQKQEWEQLSANQILLLFASGS